MGIYFCCFSILLIFFVFSILFIPLAHANCFIHHFHSELRIYQEGKAQHKKKEIPNDSKYEEYRFVGTQHL